MLEPVAQAGGGEIARRVAGQAERFGDRRAEQRIAECVQNQAERAFGDVALLMADAELGDERPDRIEDRVERVAVAGEDHPGGKRAGAFAVERVEGAVDDVAGVGLSRARAFNGFDDGRGDRIGDRPRKRALEPGCRPKWWSRLAWVRPTSAATAFSVTACGPSASSSRARGLDRGRAALLRAQSFAAC